MSNNPDERESGQEEEGEIIDDDGLYPAAQNPDDPLVAPDGDWRRLVEHDHWIQFVVRRFFTDHVLDLPRNNPPNVNLVPVAMPQSYLKLFQSFLGPGIGDSANFHPIRVSVIWNPRQGHEGLKGVVQMRPMGDFRILWRERIGDTVYPARIPPHLAPGQWTGPAPWLPPTSLASLAPDHGLWPAAQIPEDPLEPPNGDWRELVRFGYGIRFMSRMFFTTHVLHLPENRPPKTNRVPIAIPNSHIELLQSFLDPSVPRNPNFRSFEPAVIWNTPELEGVVQMRPTGHFRILWKDRIGATCYPIYIPPSLSRGQWTGPTPWLPPLTDDTDEGRWPDEENPPDPTEAPNGDWRELVKDGHDLQFVGRGFFTRHGEEFPQNLSVAFPVSKRPLLQSFCDPRFPFSSNGGPFRSHIIWRPRHGNDELESVVQMRHDGTFRILHKDRIGQRVYPHYVPSHLIGWPCGYQPPQQPAPRDPIDDPEKVIDPRTGKRDWRLQVKNFHALRIVDRRFFTNHVPGLPLDPAHKTGQTVPVAVPIHYKPLFASFNNDPGMEMKRSYNTDIIWTSPHGQMEGVVQMRPTGTFRILWRDVIGATVYPAHIPPHLSGDAWRYPPTSATATAVRESDRRQDQRRSKDRSRSPDRHRSSYRSRSKDRSDDDDGKPGPGHGGGGVAATGSRRSRSPSAERLPAFAPTEASDRAAVISDPNHNFLFLVNSRWFNPGNPHQFQIPDSRQNVIPVVINARDSEQATERASLVFGDDLETLPRSADFLDVPAGKMERVETFYRLTFDQDETPGDVTLFNRNNPPQPVDVDTIRNPDHKQASRSGHQRSSRSPSRKPSGGGQASGGGQKKPDSRVRADFRQIGPVGVDGQTVTLYFIDASCFNETQTVPTITYKDGELKILVVPVVVYSERPNVDARTRNGELIRRFFHPTMIVGQPALMDRINSLSRTINLVHRFYRVEEYVVNTNNRSFAWAAINLNDVDVVRPLTRQPCKPVDQQVAGGSAAIQVAAQEVPPLLLPPNEPVPPSRRAMNYGQHRLLQKQKEGQSSSNQPTPSTSTSVQTDRGRDQPFGSGKVATKPSSSQVSKPSKESKSSGHKSSPSRQAKDGSSKRSSSKDHKKSRPSQPSPPAIQQSAAGGSSPATISGPRQHVTKPSNSSTATSSGQSQPTKPSPKVEGPGGKNLAILMQMMKQKQQEEQSEASSSSGSSSSSSSKSSKPSSPSPPREPMVVAGGGKGGLTLQDFHPLPRGLQTETVWSSGPVVGAGRGKGGLKLKDVQASADPKRKEAPTKDGSGQDKRLKTSSGAVENPVVVGHKSPSPATRKAATSFLSSSSDSDEDHVGHRPSPTATVSRAPSPGITARGQDSRGQQVVEVVDESIHAPAFIVPDIPAPDAGAEGADGGQYQDWEEASSALDALMKDMGNDDDDEDNPNQGYQQ